MKGFPIWCGEGQIFPVVQFIVRKIARGWYSGTGVCWDIAGVYELTSRMLVSAGVNCVTVREMRIVQTFVSSREDLQYHQLLLKLLRQGFEGRTRDKEQRPFQG